VLHETMWSDSQLSKALVRRRADGVKAKACRIGGRRTIRQGEQQTECFNTNASIYGGRSASYSFVTDRHAPCPSHVAASSARPCGR
jgi:hypothetical protein